MAKEKKKENKPEINFDEISKTLGDLEQKQHIDQIGPSITEAYLRNAKYTDDKGVVRYKQKFNKDEAKKVANDVYDAMAYHAHRRVFGFDDKQYKALAGFKDPNGNPYIDSVTQYHFNVSRLGLVRSLARDDDENNISNEGLQQLLSKPIKHHASLLTQGVISKHGLDEPEHMDKVKGAIDKIVDKFSLPRKEFDTKKMYTPQDVLQAYVGLASEHYSSHRRGRRQMSEE